MPPKNYRLYRPLVPHMLARTLSCSRLSNTILSSYPRYIGQRQGPPTCPRYPAPSGREKAPKGAHCPKWQNGCPRCRRYPPPGEWPRPTGVGAGDPPRRLAAPRVERPPTERRSGTRNTGAVQRRRQRPGPRPRVLPTHQKGTINLVCAPQVVALEVAPAGKGVSRLGIGDPTGSRHPAPHYQAAGGKVGSSSSSWTKS